MSNHDEDVQPKTREELYQRIKLSSKDDFIYQDMIRLGFWSSDKPLPKDPEEEIEKRNIIQNELNQLKAELRLVNNEQAYLKELRKEKLEISNKRKHENKLKKEEERKKRADDWINKQKNQIVYLGEEVSKGLNNSENNLEKLYKYNLPVFATPLKLAEAMNISINKLRFLSYSRKISKYSHYVRFKIPKKTGGFRNISAPTNDLKNSQYWILNNILDSIPIIENVHGFVKSKSIVTNAIDHVNSDVIINIDLENFFSTFTYKRVKGMFMNLGYSESISTILALLSTEPDLEEVILDSKKYFVSTSERFLPQGAPTSPAITNIICRKLDKRIIYLSEKLGFKYTRYADDMTFSANGDNLKNIGKLLKYIQKIINEEGLKINTKKTKILRKSTSQEVTGIIVNKKMNVDKKTLKNFRATLYQIEQNGIDGKSWNNSKDLIGAITGYANFVNSVNPEKGKIFLDQIKRIKHKYQYSVIKYDYKKNNSLVKNEPLSINSTNTENDIKEKKKWWKLF